MRNAPELVVFGLFLGLLGVWWQDMVLSSPPSMLTVRQMLNVTQLRVSSIWGNFSADVQGTMTGALHDLFLELDRDGDGCIGKDEFEGMTLNTWAALRAFGMAMPDLRAVIDSHLPDGPLHRQLASLWQTTGTSFTGAVAMYICGLLMVQFVFFLYEHLHSLLGLRWQFPKPRIDLVKHCSREEALRYDTPLTGFYERAKTFFMVASGLALLKCIQGVLSFILAVLAINIMVMVPHPLWVAVWQSIARFWIYCIMFSLGFYKINIYGSAAPRSEVKMLLANHTAMVEVLVLYAAAGLPSFVSRMENLGIPLFAGVIRASNAILVDRSDEDSKAKTLQEIVRRAKEPAAPQVMIFPEGSCNNQQCLFRFNRGPFEPGEPVQLACIKFPYRHYNPCWTGRAAGGNEIEDLLLRLCCQFVNRVEVKFLPVHHPTEAECQDSTVYANNMQLLMAASLGIGISDCTYKVYRDLAKEFVRKLKESQGSRPSWLPFLGGRKADRRTTAEGKER
eukprot:GGOE01002497.1.p1 GENE.GGOE01002497.1~~GGOE01002497.1.p1  ORF type:complete len:506 (-),score=154.09 GGOE01002497.1:236-1753(-)